MTVPQKSVKWRKSSRSQNQGACVELADTRDGIRDSKNVVGPALSVPWPGLVAAIQAGRFTR